MKREDFDNSKLKKTRPAQILCQFKSRNSVKRMLTPRHEKSWSKHAQVNARGNEI